MLTLIASLCTCFFSLRSMEILSSPTICELLLKVLKNSPIFAQKFFCQQFLCLPVSGLMMQFPCSAQKKETKKPKTRNEPWMLQQWDLWFLKGHKLTRSRWFKILTKGSFAYGSDSEFGWMAEPVYGGLVSTPTSQGWIRLNSRFITVPTTMHDIFTVFWGP